MNINKRERFLIIGTLICVVAFVSDRFIISSLSAAWTGYGKEITELQRNIGKGELLVSRLDAVQATWNGMSARSLSRTLSEAENQVLNEVTLWAQESKLTITTVKPQWRQAEDDHTLLEVGLSAMGSLNSIMQFVYKLEGAPDALRIEEIDIVSRDQQGKALTLNLKFTGLVLKESKKS